MQDILQRITAQSSALVGGYLPNLLGALAILVIGWIVARILGAIVRRALGKTELDDRLAVWLAGESKAADMDVEAVAGRATYWVVMLFVLVAFFQALQLTMLTEPLNALLTEITGFVPQLLGASVLLFVAWVVATIVRKVVGVSLAAADLDRRLGAAAEDRAEVPVSKTIGEAVYWLIFLLFLPAILGALELEGLLRPVQGLTDQLLGFLPNLFAAGLIVAIGWFVARLVQRIVTNLTAAAGLDALADRLGVAGVLGDKRLSALLGLVVYVLILVPVLISALNALQLEAVTAPASDMLAQLLSAIPRLFAAAVLLALAWGVGRLVSGLLVNLLAGIGFDRFVQELGVLGSPASGADAPTEGGARASEIVGQVVLVAVVLFASVEAAGLLGFDALTQMLSGFIVFGGNVLLGVAIFAIGLWLSNLAAETIAGSGATQSRLLAVGARVAILILSGAMALREMGLADEIINLAFGLLLGAVAIAAALAFGLGSRDTAGELVREWRRAWSEDGDEGRGSGV